MITIVIPGLARPGGSKKGFFNPKLGRVMIVDANDSARPWKAQVSDAAMQAMDGRPMLQRALSISVRFYLPRPKGHWGRHGLLPSAPPFPAVKPDATKLLRPLEDAMTGIVWRDDAQIVHQDVAKLYGDPARCEVEIREVSEAAQVPRRVEPPEQAGLFL